MEHHYKDLLNKWKNDEDNIKDELKEIGANVKKISTGIKEVVKEISTDVKDLAKKLGDLVVPNTIPAREANAEGKYKEIQLLNEHQGLKVSVQDISNSRHLKLV